MGGRKLLCWPKMLKSPHKEIYSFKVTMLWSSLSSSLSLAKYFHQYAHYEYGLGAALPCCIDSPLCLAMGFWQAPDNKEERDNKSIVSLDEYISL